MKNITTPILLIGFNRPENIRHSFEAISKVQPAKLYVAIDGPREGKRGEKEKVLQVQEIVKNVDWKCETYYRFSAMNLGCGKNIPSAISWVFEKEDRVIVVEDDIVAPPSFFKFEEVMLEKYKDDNRIAMVSGNNYTPIKMREDYLFSLYAGHIWGWGTWKRLWDQFDIEIPTLKEEIANGLPKIKKQTTSFLEYCHYLNYYRNLRKAQIEGKVNYWGPQFGYFRLENGLLNIVPRVNLASNIGNISSRDSNNNTETGKFYFESHSDFLVHNAPTNVSRNVYYDKIHFKEHLFKHPYFKGMLRSIRNFLLSKFIKIDVM